MSRKRRATVRETLSELWNILPEDAPRGQMGEFWRNNHVLTLRCSACHRPRALLMAPVWNVTAEAIAERGHWRPASSDLVRNPCRCLWVEMPEPSTFRGAIVRAVRAGLGRVTEHKAVSVVASPPDHKLFHHGPMGTWVPRTEPGRTCPICDTPRGHA